MLQIDFFHKGNQDEDVTVQFNPEKIESIPMLRENLKWLNLRNVLVTFANRYKGDFYEDCSEEYIDTDAWASDCLSFLWKDESIKDDKGRPYENIMVIMERLTNAYLKEHYELMELRKQQEHTKELW